MDGTASDMEGDELQGRRTDDARDPAAAGAPRSVSYTHLRAHET